MWWGGLRALGWYINRIHPSEKHFWWGFLDRAWLTDSKTLIALCIGVALIVVVDYFAGKQLNKLDGESNLQESLSQMANEINKQCPKQIDAITVLNCSVAGTGKKFTYKYTISADLTEQQIKNANPSISKKLASQWTPENELMPIYEMGVDFLYDYHNKNGSLLFSLSYVKG